MNGIKRNGEVIQAKDIYLLETRSYLRSLLCLELTETREMKTSFLRDGWQGQLALADS